MALKKSDLYSSLWASADELRGGMDASQYKDYVLTLLFMKYVSDKAKSDPDSLIEIPSGGSFDDLVAAKGKPNVGELVNIAIEKLAEANDLQRVITNADFDDTSKLGEGKKQVDRVSNLIGIFQGIDFTGSGAQDDDLLGDAYEYLMRHFATESGKSKGQFYTPAEVSRVMAQLLEIPEDAPRSTTAYDPTAGSGSLLIKVHDAAPNGLSIYGQENDVATWALARMNMILHGIDTAEIAHGDTLADPKFRQGDRLQTFDFLVANPPFSVKTWKNGFNDDYGRLDGFATPPDKNGDYAFLLHMLKSLKPGKGRGAVILPHGVLFRGNAEAQIRKELVRQGVIKAIIGLPANLFYGTGIPACIIILDKNDAQGRTGIYMMDASKGFTKDGPKNRLRARDMHRIVDCYLRRAAIPGYARLVPVSEIASAKNDYNLNIPRYIDSSEPEDLQDLNAHLRGGIPNRDIDALSDYWQAFPRLKPELLTPLREGYSQFTVHGQEIASTVNTSVDYLEFTQRITRIIQSWWLTNKKLLEAIMQTTNLQSIADQLSEALLADFRTERLLDEYGLYEQFMLYWQNVMNDDVSMIAAEGWYEAAQPRPARILGYNKDNKPQYESANIIFGTGAKAKRWVMDLLPPEIITGRYFSEEHKAVENLEEIQAQAQAELEEFFEESTLDDGPLSEAVDSEGKLPDKTMNARIRMFKDGAISEEEYEALLRLKALRRAEKDAKSDAKTAREILNQKVTSLYEDLGDDAIADLVINEKWKKQISAALEQECQALVHKLIDRLETLDARYGNTLQEIETRLEHYQSAVAHHLAVMGVK